MGDPKKKHKKYTTPKRPYDQDMLLDELRLIGSYGLRNKKELWRAKTELSTIRRRARELLSLSPADREEREGRLVSRLHRMGLVREAATLEDILTSTVEDLLERRLQTMVFRKGLAQTLYQARQMVTHGHISINGQKVKAPGYHVKIDEESTLSYAASSPYTDPDHPLRSEMVGEEVIGETEVE